jgi:DNA-binding transcriptional LysR family regulator
VRRGQPYSVGDLKRHDLVGYDKSPLIRNELKRLGLSEEDVRFPVRCDNQTAYWELVCAGCGIGFTQLDTGRRDPRVSHIEVPFDLPKLPMWLTAHETVRRIPRVATIWEHLAEALSSRFRGY